MKIYPYRTTYDKLADGTAQETITEAGDSIVSTHYVGGRDWVLICRAGETTVAELTVTELIDAIREAVIGALRRRDRNIGSRAKAGR